MKTQLATGTLWEMTQHATVITLIGAGGKTTTLQALTKEIRVRGKNVIATTTTKVYPMPFKTVWKDPMLPPPKEIEYPCFWYANSESEAKKWVGPTVESVDQAIRLDDRIWVIEGDGAREKKLKCWASHEPQIPSESQCAILILHGGLWGKVLTDNEIHRAEKCPDLVGQVWSGEKVAQYLLNSPIFYPKYKKLNWIVLFNEHERKHGWERGERGDGSLASTYSGSKRTVPTLPLVLPPLQRDINQGPAHLRIASGNVLEGQLRWYDLW